MINIFRFFFFVELHWVLLTKWSMPHIMLIHRLTTQLWCSLVWTINNPLAVNNKQCGLNCQLSMGVQLYSNFFITVKSLNTIYVCCLSQHIRPLVFYWSLQEKLYDCTSKLQFWNQLVWEYEAVDIYNNPVEA